MFVEKFKVHPKGEKDSELAEVYDKKYLAEQRCHELNTTNPKIEWVITSYMENEGF